jgi:diphosphomevalonate decarboxylase
LHYLVECSAPSNIAFVKYWGKLPGQLPLNPSISMTLENCRSLTSVEIIPAQFDLEYIFDDKPKNDFKLKIEKYLKQIQERFPWILGHKFIIRSSNNFPHSTGIASSASFFASLAHCLVKIDQKINTHLNFDLNLTSSLARIGSGSAARSLSGPLVSWGDKSLEHASVVTSHAIFQNLMDTIVVIDDSPKSISSSEGHKLMQEHVFKAGRIEQARINFHSFSQALADGDFSTFSQIVINEAMTLHALMMTSSPSYILLKPNTLALIDILNHEIKHRKLTYTLDAGPNLHIIHHKSEQDFVRNLLQKNAELFQSLIEDRAGHGSVFVRELMC